MLRRSPPKVVFLLGPLTREMERFKPRKRRHVEHHDGANTNLTALQTLLAAPVCRVCYKLFIGVIDEETHEVLDWEKHTKVRLGNVNEMKKALELLTDVNTMLRARVIVGDGKAAYICGKLLNSICNHQEEKIEAVIKKTEGIMSELSIAVTAASFHLK